MPKYPRLSKKAVLETLKVWFLEEKFAHPACQHEGRLEGIKVVFEELKSISFSKKSLTEHLWSRTCIVYKELDVGVPFKSNPYINNSDPFDRKVKYWAYTTYNGLISTWGLY